MAAIVGVVLQPVSGVVPDVGLAGVGYDLPGIAQIHVLARRYNQQTARRDAFYQIGDVRGQQATEPQRLRQAEGVAFQEADVDFDAVSLPGNRLPGYAGNPPTDAVPITVYAVFQDGSWVSSAYSQTNKERLARLIAQRHVIPSVLARLGEVRAEDYQIPDDILAVLQTDAAAWAFFQQTSPSYQRIRAAYVDTARHRPGAFEKRLKHLVAMSAQGKQFGYGIEAYY